VIDDKSSINLAPPQVYTDLNSVQQLNVLGKTDKQAALMGVAKQFESMLVQMMMKSMRDANAVFADGDVTASSEGKFYQDMMDNQLALSLSQGRGFGIAAALMRQLQGRAGIQKTDAANTALNNSLTRQTFSLDNATRTGALPLATPTAPGDIDNPRVNAAIQDALHQLFGGDVGVTESAAVAPSIDGTPGNFVEALRPLAQRVGAALGVDSGVLLSQAALETGWGQKVAQCADGSSSFNFFNIKADANWQGAVVKVPTIEYRDGVAVREWASFRAYNSPEESFADYAHLIASNPRYQQALDCADDPRAYVKALADAGYATDPRYAQKVLAVYDGAHVQSVRATDGQAAQ
jgi:flagellar protein FlgJ